MLLLFIFVLIFSSISCYTGINPLLYSNNSCTIIFNANYEGGNVYSQQLPKYETYSFLSASDMGITRDGYAFSGWASSPDAERADFPDNYSVYLKEDMILYAVWEAGYTITYNVNDETLQVQTATQIIPVGQSQPLKTLSQLGFEHSSKGAFVGWSTSPDATTATYMNKHYFTPTEDITLYAVWVSYERGENSCIFTCYVNYKGADPAYYLWNFQKGSEIRLSNPCYREGYEFKGWTTSPESTSVVYDSNTGVIVKEDLYLYAVWECTLAHGGLSNLTVSGTPEKTVYMSGEAFDGSGLTVVANYADGYSETVTTYTDNLGTDICYKGKIVILTYVAEGIEKSAIVTGPFYIAASDSITQTVINNGTKTIDGTAYQLVKFGDFPQTIAASEINYSSSEVYNGWYLGSDGYFYEKCRENAYAADYTYSDGTTCAQWSANSEKYFKVEPIEWRVLTSDYNSTGKKLILAENLLTANVSYYNYASYPSTRSIDGSTIQPNNYKYSQIRAYLNGLTYYDDSNTVKDSYENNGFLQKAFTKSAQKLIFDTEVDNSARSTNPDANSTLWNSGTNDNACDNTTDQIFLLSEQEVTTSNYGFAACDVYIGDPNGTTESSRVRYATDYARANYTFQDTSNGNAGSWWTRSPFYSPSSNALRIGPDGNANNNNNNDIIYNFRGICPALCLSN
ncbi:MAG: InlB B-repeat-containing protein [Treponema sp.]|nr:InlB B-repeat-containing protein [Treponema sp.]